MLAGIVLSGIAGGLLGLMAALAVGQPFALALLMYSLSGCCGALFYTLRAVQGDVT